MSKVWDKQIGGRHYQDFVIQPSKFVVENKLLFPEGCAIKYICRYGHKGDYNAQQSDLKKAIHYLENEIESRREAQPDS